ncbi:helix-turn-helix transcriptional regulator [Myceligenerans pegani]|uniref:Helix-turn-helix domain-containing protein n=1 Tax=Myceligenerans pegani TaxID=2776917 RepID=A0ABR9N4B5_9MICO|nr:helix-turn-helix domain-containing protein [Myceligenerans sp. TRM 65318]MBE1878503.1 helix-turn-helix domain-containing protein [Myceligenerans sp. TRM 65318]MBE3020774.1 helix-turn-helix domain-containing protein [Myceligenerans sp. TRM 65318]
MSTQVSAPTAHPHETDGTTRRRVLQLVASDGPVTAAHLASTLGLTAPAVRRHLTLLEEEGRIEIHEGQPGPARRGRPARHYVVTHGGQSELAGGYQEIAADLLRHLRARGGDEAVRAFARERYDAVVRRYAPRLDASDPVAPDDAMPGTTASGTTPTDTAAPGPAAPAIEASAVAARAARLAALLSEDGYAASVRPVPAAGTLSGDTAGTAGPAAPTPGGAAAPVGVVPAVQLCQGHCPVQHLAEEHTELCEAEARAFTELLGTHVQRLATIAGGAHACTTNIPLPAIPTTEGSR